MTTITLHTLHAIPASLVNRDDAGNTKTITFGGTTRVRHSSQTWKRAMREWLRDNTNLNVGVRTTRLPSMTVDALVNQHEIERELAEVSVASVFEALGLKPNKKTGDTAVSLFVRSDTADKLAQVIMEAQSPFDQPDVALVTAARTLLAPGDAVDVALFGRFLAEIPGENVDGSAQVAHAMSVEPARIVPDFFTTVDDCAPGDGPASSNLGVVDLSAPVMYRTANVNVDLLKSNLGGDRDLTVQATSEFVKAFLMAMPKAKATSTAPATLPSFLLVQIGGRATSLADAFVEAVTGTHALNDASVRLVRHASAVAAFVGGSWAVLPISGTPEQLPQGWTVYAGLDALVAGLHEAI